jgi:hypothetical protein
LPAAIEIKPSKKVKKDTTTFDLPYFAHLCESQADSVVIDDAKIKLLHEKAIKKQVTKDDLPNFIEIEFLKL